MEQPKLNACGYRVRRLTYTNHVGQMQWQLKQEARQFIAQQFTATPDGIVGEEDFEIYQLPIALQDVMNKNLEEIKEIEGRQLC